MSSVNFKMLMESKEDIIICIWELYLKKDFDLGFRFCLFGFCLLLVWSIMCLFDVVFLLWGLKIVVILGGFDRLRLFGKFKLILSDNGWYNVNLMNLKVF